MRAVAGAREDVDAGGKVAALGRRAVNSFFYRTGLRRQTSAATEWTANPRWLQVEGGPLEGGWLLLDPNSPADWEHEMAEGRFDPFIYEEIDRWGGAEGATFWDVGAHIGYHSFCVAALAGPKGRVFAFEPNPHNVDRFRLHLERNPDLAGRISLQSLALSNTDGEASFEFSPTVDDGTSTGSHLSNASLPSEASEYAQFRRTTVTTARADTLLHSGTIAPPTIMKIDVEGAEQLVLEGAPGLLATARPLLFVEVHNISQMFYVQRILLSAGYEMEILDAVHASLSRCFTVARPVRTDQSDSRSSREGM
jgi:FkbM family methyltransferase